MPAPLERSVSKLNPSQIKSATGNRGTFDPANPDIRYALPRGKLARARLHQRLSVSDYVPTNVAKFWLMRSVRQIADRNTFVNRFIEHAKAIGARVGDEGDVIGWIERMPGIISRQTEHIEKKYASPIKGLIEKAKLTVAEVGEWLYARHAIERNQWYVDKQTEHEANVAKLAKLDAQIKAIKSASPAQYAALTRKRDAAKKSIDNWKKFVKGKKFDLEKLAGSGMPNSKAEAILKKHASNASLQEIGELTDKLGRLALRLRLQTGLLSQEQFQELTDRWDHYVPLKDDQENHQIRFASSRRFGAAGKEFQAARGRHSEATADPLAALLLQTLDSVERAQRNRVGQSFVNLLKANPDLLSSAGKWRELDPDEVFDPKDNPDTFTTKIDGKEVVVTVDEHLARALNQLNVEKIPEFMSKYVVPVTRYLSASATSWNPGFILPNFFRDLQTAIINIGAEDAEKLRREILKNALSGRPHAAMWRSIKGVEPKDVADPQARLWLEHAIEMEKNGGRTGWYYRKNLADLQSEIVQAAEGESRVPGVLRNIAQRLEDINIMVENSTRLAAYSALRGRGYSAQKAAHVAKNLTVNFNRSGEAGPLINSVYMFFNASVGGMLQMGRAMTQPGPGRARVWKSLGQMAMLGGLQELFNRMQGDDDEGKPLIESYPEHEQQLNYLFITPDGLPTLKFPQAYVANAFHQMGRSLIKVAFYGKSPWDEAMSIAQVAAESTNPLGASPTPIHLIMPSLADPLADIWTNTKFSGTPVNPEGRGFGVEDPYSHQSFKSTEQKMFGAYNWVAKAINDVTGGDKVKPGWADVHPGTLRHLTEFAGGGWFRFISRSGAALFGAADGTLGEISVRDLPVIRRFLTEAPEWQIRSDYWGAIEDVERELKRLDTYKKEHNASYVRELRRENGHIHRLEQAAKDARKKDKELREKLETATEEADRARIETQLDRLHRQFLTRYYKALGAVDD